MKLNKYYMPTLKEVPSDAEVPSHKLLLRAGMIRKTSAGIYSFLPLGFRVLNKIENIVRQEMDKSGAYEIKMSILQPREIWEESGRWSDFGPEMFKVKDRHEREFSLGPTAEEYFTYLVRGELKSYKELPLNMYQIQWKYRDEKRPRFGINRSKEFLMKDGYSFDVDEDSMKVSYMNMWNAYERVFDRIGLDYKIVNGDTGSMGGKKAHEFIAISDVGEGEICFTSEDKEAYTLEKAKRQIESSIEEPLKIEEVFTPDIKDIKSLSNFIKKDEKQLIKAICFEVLPEDDSEKRTGIFAFIPAYRQLNEAKLLSILQIPEHRLVMASEEFIESNSNTVVGFIGLKDLKVSENIRIFVDEEITKTTNLVCGANKKDYHYLNFDFNRDGIKDNYQVVDITTVINGDRSPEGYKYIFKRGIEVGNIFQLGTKYSKALKATFLDENGKEKPFVMGSYGIGISRTISAVVEQNFDKDGIIWPLSVAPFHVMITIMNLKEESQVSLASELEEKLEALNIEVLVDDRNERAGVKFKDRDLIGIPLRVTVGRMASERIVEFSLRKENDKKEMPVEEVIGLIKDLVNKEGR